MLVRKTPGNTIHHLHQDSSGGPRWAGKSGYDLRPRLWGSTGTASCRLCKERTLVGTALARTTIHTDRARFDMGDANSPGIRVRRVAREFRLSSSADDRCSSYDGWFCSRIENS